MTEGFKAKVADEGMGRVFQPAGLTGLFDEMTALMAVMPGAAFDANAKVMTEEEVEAMFDNMPV